MRGLLGEGELKIVPEAGGRSSSNLLHSGDRDYNPTRLSPTRTTLHLKDLSYEAIALFLTLVSRIRAEHRAEVIFDQEHFINPGGGSSNYYLDYAGDQLLEQTFTVRHSGLLAGIGVQVSLVTHGRPPYADPIDDLHLKVVRTSADGFADSGRSAGRIERVARFATAIHFW